MNPEQSPTDVYNEMTAMLQRMRQELEEIEAIKTKLAATDTRLLLTQTELKATQKQLQATEEYIDNTLVGSVTAFATINPPDGWLECNGQAISREIYQRLFAKIGITFGEGDEEKTFNLPDLRGVFIRGFDAEGKHDPNREFGSFQGDQIQSHKHLDSGHNHSCSVSSDGEHEHSGSISNSGEFTHTFGTYAVSHSLPLRFYDYDILFDKISFDKNKTNLRIPHTGPNYDLKIESHSHNLSMSTDGKHSHKVNINNASASIGNPVNSTGGEVRQGNETRSKNVALMYCIKY
jgi:Microcystin-dependent protein